MSGERVLVVDDEPGVRQTLAVILEDEGYAVSTVESGEEGLRALEDAPYDAVLLDVWLPGIDGLETLNKVREGMKDVQVIMISGHGTVETAVRATKLGAFDFIEKPLSLEKTLVVVRNAIRQRNLERRNRSLVAQIVRDTEILGAGPYASRIRSQIEAAAGSSSSVWIEGEAGTGRATIARRIHSLGSRAGRPFVPVPCASIVGEIGAATLFGGGAGRHGLLELAAGGTVFLEEVDRLSPDFQRRLASEVSAGVARDVRPMASIRPGASSPDPDLIRLLEVIRIETLPLRNRREDVPVLAQRFLRDLCREYGKPEKQLTPDAVAALQGYRWPGNVGELRNFLERLVLTSSKDVVGRDLLPAPLGESVPESADLYDEFPSLSAAVEAFERFYVRRTLASLGGDREAAARRLGLDREKFETRVRELRLR